MKSDKCFEKHLIRGRASGYIDRDTREVIHIPPLSTCEKLRVCTECLVTTTWLNREDHECGRAYCKLCKCDRDVHHLCYVPVLEPESVQPPSSRKKKQKGPQPGTRVIRRRVAGDGGPEEDVDGELSRDSDFTDLLQNVNSAQSSYSFLFYDFETSQCTPVEGSEDTYVHKVNYACAATLCNGCSRTQIGEREVEYDCECEETVFSGDDALPEFCRWLLTKDGAIAIAHNAGGFDSVLIQQHLTSVGFKLDKCIYRGRKLLTGKIPVGDHGVKLIDSLNFIMAPLSTFPKMFDISDLKKGDFPHLFNVPQNWNYSGPMPAVGFYDPDSMHEERRKEFLTWYEKNKNNHFDFQKEIRDYCSADVAILKEGMGKFRVNFHKLTGVDALRYCCTIASSAMRAFQSRFLEADSIGVIPRHGYTHFSRQSRVGLLWLKWWSMKNNARVIHNSNGQEHRVGNFMVDGYIEETRTCLEFLGCHFHSCKSCYAAGSVNPVTGKSRKAEYESTMERVRIIEDAYGYNMITIWECEWRREMDTNPEVQEFLRDQHISTPLKPYQALFGGRTNATVLFYECKNTEEIKVLDYTSLYPWANQTTEYPLHHPIIITEDFGDLNDYFGLIRCRVIPPCDLHLPMLPMRSNGRLTFPLCYTCAENMTQTACTHGDDDRGWDGTFVSVELEKAIEMGYKVERIYEIWHWEQRSVYNPETKTGGLFTEYIKTFLREKVHASGWPHGVTTEDERQAYIDGYYEVEGIRLERDKIAPSNMRAVAKLLLNSLW